MPCHCSLEAMLSGEGWSAVWTMFFPLYSESKFSLIHHFNEPQTMRKYVRLRLNRSISHASKFPVMKIWDGAEYTGRRFASNKIKLGHPWRVKFFGNRKNLMELCGLASVGWPTSCAKFAELEFKMTYNIAHVQIH